MKNIISFICGIIVGTLIGGSTIYYIIGYQEINKNPQSEGYNCSSPDYAQIKIQDTINAGEATDFEITIMKDKGGMSYYTGTILIKITDKNGVTIKNSEYSITQHGLYTFSGSDLGSKRFEKGLTINKEGKYYLKIFDFNEYKDKTLGVFPISVINNNTSIDKNSGNNNLAHISKIEILDSEQNTQGDTDNIDDIVPVNFEDHEYSTNETSKNFESHISPDSAEIKVKDPIIVGEATDFEIRILKNHETLTNYNGTISMLVTEEDGKLLKFNEYTVPSHGVYTYLLSDSGEKIFQKGLAINKEGTFYIQVEDLNENEDKILGKQLITVVNPHKN